MSDYTDDAYKILGISPTATEREIKIAYRKLALVYHPDRQSDDKQREIATTKFVQIANAYEVLSDQYLRAEYNERRQCYEPSTKTSAPTGSSSPTGKPTRNNGKNTAKETDIKHTPFRYHFSDPYEVFKRDFRDQFGIEYPGAKYDWIDFSEPIVAPANTTNHNTTKMITNGAEETQPKRKGFNLFRRKQNDKLDPSKNDRQLVVSNGAKKDLALSANTCTDIVLAEKRNNRPVSMDVKTTKEGTVTTTRTTITRPDGSTETVTTRTGIPGKAPPKPNNNAPLKQLTNGPTKKSLTNGTTNSSAIVKSNPNAMTPLHKSKVGRVGK